jgi:uncharacterized repeat protein (TIGR01451 family)
MLCLPTTAVYALGTPAGTELVSQAVMTYTQGSNEFTTPSNWSTVQVDEVLDFVVEWQDAAELPAFVGDRDEALTFRLLNTGNGTQSFRLTGLTALAGDDFDPEALRIYLDADADGLFDPSRDEPYVQGVNDPELVADQSLTLFLVCDMPAEAAAGAQGSAKLAVGSNLGYGAPGTVIHGAGDGGSDAVIGRCGGFSEVTGAYEVVTVAVDLVKSAAVLDPDGGDLPVTGAVITYTLRLTVTGTGTARDLVLTDPVPENTIYIPASLTLNGSALTDTKDADPGDVDETDTNAVFVALGDLAAGSADQTITFQVRIQ